MQALPAVKQIPVISSTQQGALLKDVLQVAERDYLYVLRSIAAQEIAGQVASGNRPTGMVIDGKPGKDINDATRSVRVWFADRGALAGAIIAARRELESIGRRVTGRTLAGLRFYSSVGAAGAITPANDPRAIAASVANPGALDFYVSLPLPHVRKWQWLNASGGRAKRATRNRILTRWARASKTKAIRVAHSVFEQAARRVQTEFRGIDATFIYMHVDDIGMSGTTIDRIPAIKVRIAVRGRMRTNG